MADIQWRGVESSNVLRVGWSDGGMYVMFRSGNIYFYYGVSRQRAVAMIRSTSVGRYLNSKIKGKFASERIDV